MPGLPCQEHCWEAMLCLQLCCSPVPMSPNSEHTLPCIPPFCELSADSPTPQNTKSPPAKSPRGSQRLSISKDIY